MIGIRKSNNISTPAQYDPIHKIITINDNFEITRQIVRHEYMHHIFAIMRSEERIVTYLCSERFENEVDALWKQLK